MHLFQSQVISTVKATEADEHQITFVGHYRHGDGFSLPGCGGLIMVVFFVILFAIYFHMVLFVLLLCFLPPTMALLLYEKKLVFDLDARQLQIQTQSIRGQTKAQIPFEDLKLRIEKIHIRLATNCGALDLLLPEGLIIRLIVDGKFEWTLEKAERLASQTGIPLQSIG